MLEGKVAIVTGGSRGIGFAIAEKLASQGADVVVCSRTEKELNEAIEKLSTKGKALGRVTDVSQFRDCQRLIDSALSITGTVDILVNNAGIFGPVGFLETNDPEVWKGALSVNLLGAVYCSKLVIPYMRKQGRGKIINLAGAGVGGAKPLPRFSAYYTSKAAIVSFTETLASELQSENIQVNAVAPGAVASELTLSLLKLDKELVGEEMYEVSKRLKAGESTPLELAANLVSFLVSPEADGITGRLISAKWDDYKSFAGKKIESSNLYRLRRINNKDFYEKE